LAAASPLRTLLVFLPALGLVSGLVASLPGHSSWSICIWTSSTLPVLIVLCIEIVTSLRRGDASLLIAALSMSGALLFHEEFAAVVVASPPWSSP